MNPPPVIYYTAVNRRGRETCGTSTLTPTELETKLTNLGWTHIRTSTTAFPWNEPPHRAAG
jgi:hypothetical protein